MPLHPLLLVVCHLSGLGRVQESDGLDPNPIICSLALPWQERNELEDVGQWACGRPDVGGGLPPIDSDGEDAVFSEELTLEKLQEPGAGCSAAPAPPDGTRLGRWTAQAYVPASQWADTAVWPGT